MKKIAIKLPGTDTLIQGDKEFRKNFEFGDATLGDIVSALLPYIFVLAGLVLFFMLIIGGFGLMTAGGSPDKVKAAQGKITSAVIGFVIIFISYWLAKILEIILGITILG